MEIPLYEKFLPGQSEGVREKGAFLMGQRLHIRNQSGSSKIEYVILVSLIALFSIGALNLFGGEIQWRMAGGGTHGSIDPYFSGSPCMNNGRCRRHGNLSSGGDGGNSAVNSGSAESPNAFPSGGGSGNDGGGGTGASGQSQGGSTTGSFFPIRKPLGDPSGN
ncbi:MAG: Flp family type IVb pilin [Bdellovibrionales bacterium]|nr:Flp family type IVb pilin [Bdellovibrionales bacterium]